MMKWRTNGPLFWSSAATAAIMAIALQVFAAWIHAAIQRQALSDPFSGAVIICSASGPQLIQLGPDGRPLTPEPGAPTGKHQGGKICPVCAAIASVTGPALPVASIVLPTGSHDRTPLWPSARQTPTFGLRDAYPQRGPPSFV